MVEQEKPGPVYESPGTENGSDFGVAESETTEADQATVAAQSKHVTEASVRTFDFHTQLIETTEKFNIAYLKHFIVLELFVAAICAHKSI